MTPDRATHRPDELEQVAQQFDLAWQKALRTGADPPDVDSHLEQVDAALRDALAERLESIRQGYLQLWESAVSAPTQLPTQPPDNVSSDVEDGAPPPLDTMAPAQLGTAETIVSQGPPPLAQDTIGVARDGPSSGPGVAVQVPGYEVLDELGRGGMGVVYRARQAGLNRFVALKMILAGAHADADQLTRFRAEAEAVAQLQHVNIVQVFDVGEHEGLPFFSLEFVDGSPLDEEMDGKPLVADRAASIVEQVARAMHYAHERGIVHRDLKPANILLTADGVPKVSDFGLVKRLDSDSSQTRTGTIMGTPSFMAPEQGRGDKDIGPAADVYALGSVLYCLLTGRPPFAAATPMDTLLQVLNDDPVPPTRLQSQLAADLETICLKCLQKDIDKRYASAGEVADDLQRYQNGEPILARPVSRWERAWRWCRRNPRVAIPSAAAALLVATLMVGGPVAAGLIYQQKQVAEQARATAVKREQQARDAERAAEASARRAEKARAAEEVARREAEENRDSAISANRDLVVTVQDMLRDQPGARELRTKLLLIGLDGLKKIAPSESSAVRVDTAAASAHRRLGDALMELGRAADALEQYRACHRIVLALNREKPDDVLALLNLGRSFAFLGAAAAKLQDTQDAREHFLQSLAAFERALPTAGTRTAYTEGQIAMTCGRLANTLRDLGRPRQALEYMRRGMLIRRRQAEAKAGQLPPLRELSGALQALGDIELQLGETDAARSHYEQALEHLKVIAEATPNTISGKSNVAICQHNVATAALFSEDIESAVEHWSTAEELFRATLDENPGDARFQEWLARVHYSLGAAEVSRDNRAAAESYFKQCLSSRQRLADSAQSVNSRLNLMIVQARCRLVKESTEIAAKIAIDLPDDPNRLFHVACAYAICSGVTESDEQRVALREQALSHLQAAVAKGHRGAALMRLDPDLAALRGLPAFESLVAEMQASEAAE